MKKLTLLVAGLAMAAFSAFADPSVGGAYNVPVPEAAQNFTGTEGYAYIAGIDLTYPTGDATDYKWMKIVASGNLSTFRIEHAAGKGEGWLLQSNANAYKIITGETAPTDDQVANANHLTVWIDLGARQMEGATTLHLHQGGAGGTGTISIEEIVLYNEGPSGEISYAWESQDGSVKLNKIDVNGNIMEDLSFPNPIYWYDTYANAWMEDYPAINQNFTFAIEAKDADTKAFCDYAGAGEAIPTFGIHTWDLNGGLANEQSGDFRVQRIDDYIYGADMNASAIKGAQGGAFEIGVCGADESLAEFWFNATITFIGDEVAAGETEAWWKVITGTFNLNFKAALPTADVMPAIDAEWAETVGATLTAGVNAFGSTTGIEDVIADSIESGKAIKAIIDGNVVIVKGDEVFSILGAKIK